jgi:thymidine kinase
MVQYKPDGHLEVITGCMFAGKTQELLRRVRRAKIADQDVEVFTPKIDDRTGEEIIGTHEGKEYKATVVTATEDGMQKLRELGEDADVIAIDEFNFLSRDFISVLKDLASNDTRVMVSGIDQTFAGEPFTPVDKLMAVADEVDKLHAICESCGGKATMNQRLIDGQPAHANAPIIDVGGEEKYEARCRQCHTVVDSVKTEPSD